MSSKQFKPEQEQEAKAYFKLLKAAIPTEFCPLMGLTCRDNCTCYQPVKLVALKNTSYGKTHEIIGHAVYAGFCDNHMFHGGES